MTADDEAITEVESLAKAVGMKRACAVLGVARATVYRIRSRRQAAADGACEPATVEKKPRPSPPRTFSHAERKTVLDRLNSEEFADCAPAVVHAKLLERGEYIGSPSTMYRILRDADEVRERRHQRQHPPRAVPRLKATGPNQVWSYDITKLRGAQKGVIFSLDVIIDMFSRFVVGWLVADCESAELVKQLIDASLDNQGLGADSGLTIHSDCGPPMTSQSVGDLLAKLGVAKSFSRPRTSNDNPYSEAQFKTLKYHRTFPTRFESLAHAREFCREFFQWYNHDHQHSGIALLTPASVHGGFAEEIQTRRQATLNAAYAAHPERFVNAPPTPPALPTAVTINLPTPEPTPIE